MISCDFFLSVRKIGFSIDPCVENKSLSSASYLACGEDNVTCVGEVRKLRVGIPLRPPSDIQRGIAVDFV